MIKLCLFQLSQLFIYLHICLFNYSCNHLLFIYKFIHLFTHFFLSSFLLLIIFPSRMYLMNQKVNDVMTMNISNVEILKIFTTIMS